MALHETDRNRSPMRPITLEPFACGSSPSAGARQGLYLVLRLVLTPFCFAESQPSAPRQANVRMNLRRVTTNAVARCGGYHIIAVPTRWGALPYLISCDRQAAAEGRSRQAASPKQLAVLAAGARGCRPFSGFARVLRLRLPYAGRSHSAGACGASAADCALRLRQRSTMRAMPSSGMSIQSGRLPSSYSTSYRALSSS